MDIEYDDEPRSPVPAWLAPILQRQAAQESERAKRHQYDGHHLAGVINRRLASLDIDPLSPAAGDSHGLSKALLLKPGTCDDGGWGVRAGWHENHVAVYAFDLDDEVEHYVGPLETVEDAADARRGPRATRPEPADHAEIAEAHLNTAVHALSDVEDSAQQAIVAASCAQARAVLALNETVSRIGARHAVAMAARLTTLTRVASTLTPGEQRLLDDLNMLTRTATTPSAPDQN